MLQRCTREVLNEQLLNKDPGSTDLAGRNGPASGKALGRLGVDMKQGGCLLEVQRAQIGSFSGSHEYGPITSLMAST